MATLTFDRLTAMEIAKRLDPKRNSILPIVEQLTLLEHVFAVMPWIQSDDTSYHKVVRRTSVPSGDWVGDNEGTDPVATTTEAVEEPMGKLKALSYADCDAVDRSVNPDELRFSEAKGILQGMGNEIMSKTFYGNRASDIKAFTGLAPRMGTLNAKTVVDGSGTGSDVTSIYAIVPGPETLFYIYPRNFGGKENMGITRTNLNKDLVLDSNSKSYLAYREQFKVEMGMCVKDPRAVGRYANIETAGASNLFDEDVLMDMIIQMLNIGEAVVLLMNRTTLSQVKKTIKDKANVQLSYDEAFGRKGIPHFQGHPILISDSILNTESAIS